MKAFIGALATGKLGLTRSSVLTDGARDSFATVIDAVKSCPFGALLCGHGT
jgi:hypothetical protein